MHFTAQALKMEAASSSGTSMIIYQSIQRYVPEDVTVRQHLTIRAYLHSHSGPALGVGDLGGHPWGHDFGISRKMITSSCFVLTVRENKKLEVPEAG
jgi:hypothetical protein